METLLKVACLRKRHWFGHTTGRPSRRRATFAGLVEGARGRGRSNRTWAQWRVDRVAISSTCERSRAPAEMEEDRPIGRIYAINVGLQPYTN